MPRWRKRTANSSRCSITMTSCAEALVKWSGSINDHPDIDVIYSDEDKIDGGAQCDPYSTPIGLRIISLTACTRTT